MPIGTKYAPIPIKRLTLAKTKERQDKSLCYKCDKQFVSGHRRKRWMWLVLDADTNEPMDDTPDNTKSLKYQCISSLNIPLHKTLRANGCIKRQHVVILTDSGRAHNFVDLSMAKQNGCCMKSSQPFKGMVANGGKLPCCGKCPNSHLTMQGYLSHTDMHILPLGGCNVVLGDQWLRTLGPILWDFVELKRQFSKGRH